MAPPGVPLHRRVVEVRVDLGAAHHPRYRFGSGYRLGGRLVLTAAHVVAGAPAGGVTVRGPDKHPRPAAPVDGGGDDQAAIDLALLELPPGVPELPPVPVAIVDPEVAVPSHVADCWAVGYPAFQETGPPGAEVRETLNASGVILPGTNLVSGLLSLHVMNPPQALPPQAQALHQSPWAGMSGAAVFAGERLVGVVDEHAPRQGDATITVIPIAFVADLDPDCAARWWARLGVADPAELPRLPRPPAGPQAPGPAGSGAPARRRVPASNVPALPEHFTRWAESFAAARAALLGPGRSDAARLVGLVGMGGAGKSVLACALGRDPQVRRAFRDGIVWLRMGPDRDPASGQKALAEALGEHREADWQLRLDRLNQLLDGAACLVIIDDVWNREQLRGFRLSEPRSALLVTTRSKDALFHPSITHEVRPLGPGPARQLLARCADLVPAALPADAEEVGRQCGGSPLALVIAGGMAREGYRWRHLADHLRKADLPKFITALSGYAEYDNLFLVLDVSVSSLPAEDRDRYLDLAVFEDRGDVPVEVAFRLWRQAGLADSDCGALLFKLERRSLLRRGHGDTFSLHSLQFKYARGRLGENRLQERHADLASMILHGWGGLDQGLPGLRTTRLGDPAERYSVLHIAAHLRAAARDDDIHRLLALESSAAVAAGPAAEAENTWYAVHDRMGESLAFAADVALAQDLARASADRALAAAEPAAGLGLEVRYALLSASMFSISASIPPPLVVALVADGQWTAGQGVKQARLRPAAEDRARILIDLLACVDDGPSDDPGAAGPALGRAEIAAEASAAASAIGDPAISARMLTELAARVPEPGPVAAAAAAVLAVPWPLARARALAALTAEVRLPTALRRQFLERAGDGRHPRAQALILTALAPQLGTSDRATAVRAARAAIDAISEPDIRALALAALLRHLPAAERRAARAEAEQAAGAILNPFLQATVLIALAAQVTGDARSALLSRAREQIAAISRPEEKAAALTALIPGLSARAVAEQDVLAAVRLIEPPEAKAAALTALIPVLSPTHRSSLIRHARDAGVQISTPEMKAAALIVLAGLDPRSEFLQEQAEDAILTIISPAARAAACTDLAHCQGPGARRSATLARALAEARAIDDAGVWAAGVARLTAHLPSWDDPAAELDGRRAVDQVIAEARASGRPKPLAVALAAVAPAVPDEDDRLRLLHEAVLRAHDVGTAGDRAEAFTALLRPLPEPGRRAALGQACRAAAAIPDEPRRQAALSALAAVAPDAVAHQAGEVTRAIEAVRTSLAALDAALAAAGLEAADRPAVLRASLAVPAPARAAGLLPPLTPERDRRAVVQGARDVAAAVGGLRSRATALVLMAAAGFAPGAGPGAGAAAVDRARSASARLPELADTLDDDLRVAVRAIGDAQAWVSGQPPESATAIAARTGAGTAPEAWTAGPDQDPRPGTVQPWDAYWRPVIEAAAQRGRAALISELSAMGPVLIQFGGRTAVPAAVGALLDVGRWWR